jgi:NNP family nitrate/nitrite transporter-like MFS transporter
MFHRNVVGSANALAGGWGNMGGGLTYILMPLVYEAFLHGGLTLHMAWRVSMIIPACLCLIVGVCCFLFVDDCPQGKWKDHVFQVEEDNGDADEKTIDGREIHTVTVKDTNSKDTDIKDTKDRDVNITSGDKVTTSGLEIGKKREIIEKKSFSEGALIALANYNVWILIIMYACSFGVELAVDNVLGIFFAKQFGLPLKEASLISSLFGLMNLFSRASGGFLSDYGNYKAGMRGRLLIQFLVLFFEGTFLIVFRYSLGSLSSSIVVLIIFSYFVQACCGTSFGIVPFVDPAIVGSLTGLIGAGGNLGGLFFNFVF